MTAEQYLQSKTDRYASFTYRDENNKTTGKGTYTDRGIEVEYARVYAQMVAQQEAIGFAEWIIEQSYDLTNKGWQQFGDNNFYTSDQIYLEYQESKTK